jgi:hypothetical protein
VLGGLGVAQVQHIHSAVGTVDHEQTGGAGIESGDLGSAQGGGKYLPQVRADQRYVPGGLDRKDGFFGVAVQLYDFLGQPRAPIPAERRLSL